MMINLPLKYETLGDGTEIGVYERKMPWGEYHKIMFVCKDGVPVSLPFEQITPTEDGYAVRFGRYAGRLDKEGRLLSDLSFDYNPDTIEGIADDFLEAYLESTRKEMRQAMKESELEPFISNARISARYGSGMG